MKNFLHLDLLKEDERYSYRPIRLRVMMPLAACLITLCLLVWWSSLCFNFYSQTQFKKKLQEAIVSLTPTQAAVLESRAQEQEFRSIIQQLTLYKNARNLCGNTLSNLTEYVPSSIQFAELRLSSPFPPLIDALHPAIGPTNTFEQVTLRIFGRTGGAHPSESVNALLATLYTPTFTNFFRSAMIPKGAFRQDASRNLENRETMLFEIICECLPRRFQ